MFVRRHIYGAIVALCCGTPALGGEALEAIHTRGSLLVGTTGDYKPFTFREPDGRYSGADIVMAEHLARRLGVRLQLVPTAWPVLLDDFTAGKFDVAMGGVSVNAARAARGTFSTVVYVDGKRPVARCADQDRFTSVEAIDQPSVRVIVNPGGTNSDFAQKNLTHAAVTIHSDNTTVFDEIIAGRADVMVTDGIEADHQALMHPSLCPTHVAAPFTRLEKAYLARNDPDLVREINGLIATETASGEWPRMLAAAQAAP